MDLTPTPKIGPRGPKKVQKGSKLGRMKNKDRAVIPKPKLIVYIDRFQNLFELQPKPKIAPKGLKEGKQFPKWGQIKIIR